MGESTKKETRKQGSVSSSCDVFPGEREVLARVLNFLLFSGILAVDDPAVVIVVTHRSAEGSEESDNVN